MSILNVLHKRHIVTDYIQNNKTNLITSKFLFQINKNPTNTKAADLKSNVFDKMLSDEMLSIKKHFYKQDNIRSTISVRTSTKNNAATPTLEVKQKWAMIGFTQKPVNVFRDENTLKNNDKISKLLPGFIIGGKSDDIERESEQVKGNEKVLELRSLPNAVHGRSCQGQRNKVCTCMKSNLCTSCSRRCTGAGTTATRSQSYGCSSTTQKHPISYIYYQPYFVGVTTQSPYVINELEVTGSKHRKSTKPCIYKEMYYYDSNVPNDLPNKHNGIYYDDYLDYYKDVERQPEKTEEVEDTMKIHMIEYDNEEKNKHIHKNEKNNHHGHLKTRNKLVQNLFDDLKNYYSDSVIKDCYCVSSSSIFIVGGNHYLLFIAFILCLIVY